MHLLKMHPFQLYVFKLYLSQNEEDFTNELLQIAKLEALVDKYEDLLEGHVNLDDEDDTQNDYQLVFENEQCRAPEVLFQPGMVGSRSIGLIDTAELILSKMPNTDMRLSVIGNILLTGGNTSFKGLDDRIQRDIISISPENATIQITRSETPMLDAFRGAANYAATDNLFGTDKVLSKAQYEEYGINCKYTPHAVSNRLYS